MKVNNNKAAAANKKANRLITGFLGNIRAPVGRWVATGEIMSARVPTRTRAPVFAIDISLTWDAMEELYVDCPVIESGEK